MGVPAAEDQPGDEGAPPGDQDGTGPNWRAAAWARTMAGTTTPQGVVLAHGLPARPRAEAVIVARQAREEAEQLLLAPGATRSSGAGKRVVAEQPDPLRTCFERDRDRILHSSAFRRLAGKTQVFVFPRDHQRTRLTHALEVAQVATAVARATGLNVALTEAIALGHDCGHGPGGHASEEAFTPYLAEGYNHAIWGADVILAPLNLCAETLDGIRHHSWSLPSPVTPEGAVVSWADRCAYCAHDLEDAAGVGIVSQDELPPVVTAVAGRSRASQLNCFINALVECISSTGEIGMRPECATALAALREFNYERIYTRPSSVAQGRSVIAILSALVEYFAENPARVPSPPPAALHPGGGASAEGDRSRALRSAITYVSGMTDRFAFNAAVELLGWPRERLPRGIDAP